jgi:predicted PurR-regulated permease PerM
MIMSGSGRNALIICASVLAIAALYFARSVFAPAAVSLFAVAVVWPVQKWLEERLPQLIALAITLLLTVFVLSALLALSVWGIGQVGRWMIINAAQVQAFYVQLTQWLESHGIFVVGIFLDRFDVAWLVRPAQGLASTVRTLIAFALLVLVFMMLALLEVRDFKTKLQTACPEEFASRILRASKQVAEKFRRYA